MAHVGGPTRHLPGDTIPFPSGTKCDNHPDRLATKRLVGETDSFGYEAADLWDECYAKVNEDLKAHEQELQACDMCGASEVLAPVRDPDEGMAGPVYYACKSCRKALADYHANDGEY